MIINTVIEYENSYLVNGVTTVPKADGNKDYRAIQEWIADGNTPEQYIEPEPKYVDLRLADYPSLQEQQDMQYWDAINGTTVWLDTITAIKAKYPKE